MLTVPLGQDIRLELKTYAPPLVAGGSYTLENADADSVRCRLLPPSGTETELAGELVLDEDGNPITGTYHATLRASEAGVWRGTWSFELAGGEQGVVAFSVRVTETIPAVD